MKQSTHITLPYHFERAPPRFEDHAIAYPESLVRYILNRYTATEDKVFDPFAGLGTTLFVAEEMRRIPYGLEIDAKRHEWVAAQLSHWPHLYHADARNLTKLKLPKMDVCLTSPPFMPRSERWNPLATGNPAQAGYETYLRQMRKIFRNLTSVMKRNARLVVQVDNIPGRIFTPLIRDIGLAIAASWTPETEITVLWEDAKPDYLSTQLLVFWNRPPDGQR